MVIALPGNAVRALRGRGYGVDQPVLLADVWVGAVGSMPGPAVDEALGDAVRAATDAHFQSPGLAADFRRADQAWAIRVAHWAGVLQRAAGLPVVCAPRLVMAGQRRDGTLVRCAVPYHVPRVAAAALSWSAEALSALADGDGIPPHLLQRAQELVEQWRSSLTLGQNTSTFLERAVVRDLPWRVIAGGIVVYGQGARARRMDSSLTEDESALSVRLAMDKVATGEVLRQAGLPGSEPSRVEDPEGAVRAAEELGEAVVVKPARAERGCGVQAGLVEAGEIREAFRQACEYGPVLVERHAPGKDFRLFVAWGRLLWVVQRTPAGVTGDGCQTVTELVTAANGDPRRDSARHAPLKPLPLDARAQEVLARQGMGVDSVPEEGCFVRLREEANISSGGSPRAVTGDVHPDNRRLAERAARVMGLCLAGVDVLTPDIGRSWTETGAVIIEVNAQPQLGLVTGRHLFDEVLSTLVTGNGRIPWVVVLGGELATATAEALQRRWRQGGRTIGLATPGGVRIDDEQWLPEGESAWRASQALVASPEVEGGVLAAEAADVARDGLAFHACTLVVLAGGQASTDGVVSEAVEAMRQACTLLWPGARRGAVVNGQDPVATRMSGELPANWVRSSPDGSAEGLAGWAARVLEQEDARAAGSRGSEY